MSTTFVNLPVRDVDRAVDFFTALGFTCAQRSPDLAHLFFSDTAHLMLHSHAAFGAYTGLPVTDTATSREVIVGLGVESRERVDELTAKAVAAGGAALGDAQDQGYVYMRGFRDLDGHQWSFLHLGG